MNPGRCAGYCRLHERCHEEGCDQVARWDCASGERLCRGHLAAHLARCPDCAACYRNYHSHEPDEEDTLTRLVREWHEQREEATP